MKSEEKNNEVNVNKMRITLEVEKEVVEKVRSGEIPIVNMDIDEENQNYLL